MRRFTDVRTPSTPDELWLTEHRPVFTQGQAGKAEFVLAAGDIPIVQSDRGGQVTYHGPGQIVGYLMFDLHRLGLGIRALVTGIEDAIVAVLARYDVVGSTQSGAPGVYVEGDKIAALGLRVRHGCSYHGLALNVAMDLSPYARIVPCGLTGIGVTTLAELVGRDGGDALTAGTASRCKPVGSAADGRRMRDGSGFVREVAPLLVSALTDAFGFSTAEYVGLPKALA